MKRNLKESHIFVIIATVWFSIGTIIFHLILVDFDELDYMKARLVNIDYNKQYILMESANGTSVILNLTCGNSNVIIEKLNNGDELEVWFQVLWWPFKPEIWGLKKGNALLCGYQEEKEKLSNVRNIGIAFSLVAWCLAIAQYYQRRKIIEL